MIRLALENAIHGLVQPRLAITTIWEKRSTPSGASIPRPTTPYASLNLVTDLTDGLPSGRGNAVLSGSDYLQKTTEDRYSRTSLRVFGAGAWDKLSDLRLFLNTPTAMESARVAGLGLVNTTEPVDLSDIDGAGWEQVVTMDMVWHRRESIETDEGYIEIVEFPVTYKDGDTTVATETVTADAS